MEKFKLLKGATLGALLGSLALLYPRRHAIFTSIENQSEDLLEQAKTYSDKLLRKGLAISGFAPPKRNHFVWIGSLTSVVLGIGAAILLAPKSGKRVRGKIRSMYKNIFTQTEKVLKEFKNNSHPYQRAEKEIALPRPKRKRKPMTRAH